MPVPERVLGASPASRTLRLHRAQGTGSGILAYFAIKAGARKVYAVEASNVADRARTLIAANGLSDRIIVLKSKVEELTLPGDEKVGRTHTSSHAPHPHYV